MVDLTYSPQIQPDALPGRAYPHVPEEVPSGAFGGEVGRAVEYAGTEVQQHVNAAMDQARQSQLTDAHNQLQALSLGLTHDPSTGAFTKEGKDAFGISGQYLPKFDEQAANIVAAVPDPRARQAAALAAGQVRNPLSEQLDTHELEQHRQFGIKTAQTSVELAQQTAAANYNHPDILATNRDHIDASLESLAHQQGWSDDMLNESKYQAHVKMNEGVIGNMLADQKVPMAKAYYDAVRAELRPQDAKTFERAIQDGEVSASANSILGAYKQDTNVGADALSKIEQSGLTPEQQAKVTEEVDRGRAALANERRQDPANRRALTALDGSIASGTVTPGALGTVESLWRKGALTDDQRLTMRDQILRAQKKGDQEELSLDYVRDHVESSTPMDGKSAEAKKAVNSYLAFTTMGSPAGSDAYNNAAVAITSRVGVVPESAVSFGRASIVGADPDTAAKGAQLLASLQRANPRAYMEATDEQTRAMAESINSAVTAGASPEGAVNLTREATARSATDKKFLDDAWNSQRSPGQKWMTIDSNAIRNGLADDEHYKAPGLHLSNTVPVPPTPMAAEFSELTKQYFYHTDGNLKQAQQLAINDLKATWGVSEVNGSRELMKYAPERMFPYLSKDDIRSDMAASGYGAARLVEGPETGSSGGRVWSLAQKDEFGAWDVVRNDKGMPVRYQLPGQKKPDPMAEVERQTQEDQDRAALNRRRQREDVAAQNQTPGVGY